MTTNTCTYKVQTNNGEIKIEASKDAKIYGRYDALYNYQSHGDQLTVRLTKDLPILIATQEEPVIVLGSLLSETLHYMLRDSTLSHAQEELSSLCVKSKKSIEERKREFETLINQWLIREETVVHALVEHYLKERATHLGLPTEKDKTHYATVNSRYKQVPQMQEKINSLGEQGPAWAYGGYKFIPHHIFKD
tara:strand:- start:799 stop:1374 length:576 start_codon:yes stop_codon:yes gene_type:complete